MHQSNLRHWILGHLPKSKQKHNRKASQSYLLNFGSSYHDTCNVFHNPCLISPWLLLFGQELRNLYLHYTKEGTSGYENEDEEKFKNG